MRLQRLALGALAALLALAPGCLESNPQPSPLDKDGIPTHVAEDITVPTTKGEGSVDEELIFASAPGDDNAVIVVGGAGAAMDAEGVYASAEDEEPSSNGEGDGDDDNAFGVGDDGSFILVIPDVTPPKIVLTFVYPDLDDVVVEVVIPGTDADDDEATPWLATGANAEEPSGSPPGEYDGFENGAGLGGILAADNGDGTATVTGGFLSVTPLARIVIVNLASNAQAIALATTTGEFTATLPGQAGDSLSLFAVNPGEKEKATAPELLIVE